MSSVVAKQQTAQAGGRSAGVQRRGVERVQAILEAAQALLAEEGYDAATLKAIGDRAGIPTASMYHYFRDRHQVEIELLDQHLDRLAALLDAALAATPHSLADAIDSIVDPMLTYFRDHPDCAALWFRGRQPDLEEKVQAFDGSYSDQLWQTLVTEGLLRNDTPAYVVRLAFEAGSRLFDVAFRDSPTGDDVVMAEARRIVVAYLKTYAPTA